ncbi:MAG: radical SAM protein, partial [Calditrichaeota bacterium]
AKQRKICVTTSTNAHFLDDETARQTVASGLDALIVSVDGADQATYETYRVGGRLNDVLQGIANLVREKARQQSKTPYLYVQFIAMKHNEHQIGEMKRLCRAWRVDRLLIKTVQVENVAQAHRWLPSASSLQRYRLSATALRPKRLVRGPCHRPWTSSLVNCDGTVVPCCFDKNGTHAFGRIGNGASFEKIWNTSAYDSFRTKILRERGTLDICANCSQGLRLYL